MPNAKVTVTPILSGRFDGKNSDATTSIEFVYGSHLKPSFESINCNEIEKVTCLVRPTQKTNHVDEINGKSNLVVSEFKPEF